MIILVIFDHNEYAHKIFPLFLEGFSFHVTGFLALPFLRPADPLERKTLEKMFFSYYYPFFWIVSGMTLLNALMIQSVTPTSILNFLLALYSGNAQILKNVTQMSLLWFLPSFFSLMLMRSIMATKTKPIQIGFLIAIFLAHFLIGNLTPAVRNFIPLGLLPISYALPLILLIVKLHKIICQKIDKTLAFFSLTIAFLIVKFWQIHMNLSQELGFAMVADYRNISALIVNDLEAITGTLMLFQLANFNLGKLIEKCGQNSMQIYLFHAFVALGVYKTLENILPNTMINTSFVISMSATVTITLLVALFIMKNVLTKRLLFPRSWNELFHKNDEKK